MKRFVAFLSLIALPTLLQAKVRPNVDGLDEETAARRAERVSKVRYDLFFSLGQGPEKFSGRVEASFDLKGAGEDLTYDFKGGKVLGTSLNGRALGEAGYNGKFLTLPAAALREGANRLVVEFEHPYSKTGAGLYRFQDPEDKSVYVYTDFEPYDANRLFPCFDQPDLKATYKVRAEAPSSWVVVTSNRETDVKDVKGSRKLWIFPESKPFSTYIFSLHGGPFQVWEDKNARIPSRLLARKKLAPHMDAEAWFKITRQGFDFFEEYFDYPHPFTKYDQLIVPDFNSGAMENTGAITFNELYVYRGSPTWRQRQRRAAVILHEMAHMWFGNLVTMKWWDDLWLNESFASYLAYLALERATEFKDAWISFHLGMKQWAYWEDQLVTTHPIEAVVPNTEQAFANFDGITYGKGASALKQVAFLIGGEGFRDGVRAYFKTHAFKNTRRADFIASLEEGSGKDLQAWTPSWLQKEGLDRLKARFACEKGKIVSFSLRHSGPDGTAPVRSHRTQIAFFDRDESGRLVLAKEPLAVSYRNAETTVPEAVGRACPALVFPNDGDHDYVKVALDERSLETIKKDLSRIEDDLSRATLWSALWEMVQDAELEAGEFAEIVVAHVGQETSFQTLSRVLEKTYGRRMNSSSVLRYLSKDAPKWKARRARWVARLEAFFESELSKAAAGSDFQKLWFDSFVRVAESPKALLRLHAMLEGKGLPRGFELDQDRRWKIVIRFNRLGDPRAREMLNAEAKRDASHRGKLAAIKAAVIRPSWDEKKAWIRKVSARKSKESLGHLKAAMRGFFPYEQAPLRRRYAKRFYKLIPKFSKKKPPEFLSAYAWSMVPATCEEVDAQSLGDFLTRHEKINPVVRKILRISKQEEERCLKIRALSAKKL